MVAPASLSGVIITYNCGRELIDASIFSRHIHSFLSPIDSHSSSNTKPHLASLSQTYPDILVFSLQEVAPIAHSFLGGRFLAPYLRRVQAATKLAIERQSRDFRAGEGGQASSADLTRDHCPRYVSVATHNAGMTAIIVLLRADLEHQLVSIDVGGTGVGWYEMGNKGAVGVSIRIKDERSRAEDGGQRHKRLGITFVAAHLAPMEWDCDRRNRDFQCIAERLVLEPIELKKNGTANPKTRDPRDVDRAASPSDPAAREQREPLLETQDDDNDYDEGTRSSLASQQPNQSVLPIGIYHPTRHVLFAGDLNYRTSDRAPRPYSRAMFPHLLTAEAGTPQHYKQLLVCDQLERERQAGRTLIHFEEAPLDFAPTYKYSEKARQEAGRREQRWQERESASKSGRQSSQSNDTEDYHDDAGDTHDNTVRKPDPLPQENPLDWPWSGHRWPSWCDRILYLSPRRISNSPANSNGPGSDSTHDSLTPLHYTSLPLMSTSDHQPVALHFAVPWKTSSGPESDGEGDEDGHLPPPFEIDPNWKSRRVAARRLEVAVGVAAYLTTTFEGGVLVSAVLLGAGLGWAVIGGLV